MITNIINKSIPVHKTNPNWNYPLLSEFIKELEVLLREYGDGYVAYEGEYTDEIHGISVDKIGKNDCRMPEGNILYTIS